MRRRLFLKSLCASAALALSSLLPDLAPRQERATRWRITVHDPYDRAVHVLHWVPAHRRTFDYDPGDHAAAIRAIGEACERASMDRIIYGTHRMTAERIA